MVVPFFDHVQYTNVRWRIACSPDKEKMSDCICVLQIRRDVNETTGQYMDGQVQLAVLTAISHQETGNLSCLAACSS